MNTEICLFFIISGLLLASLLRKPTIEGQSSMDEFKKMVRSKGFLKLTKDKFCIDIIKQVPFPWILINQ